MAACAWRVTGAATALRRIVGRRYGNLISTVGVPTVQTDMRYAGLFYHALSGLYLATYRAFDPVTGRWISRDPIEESGGLNLYGYVGGNPLTLIDPWGLCSCDSPSLGLGAIIGGGIGGALGSAGGAVGGVLLGGTGGTFVAPGPGTIAGVGVGADVGYVAGGVAGTAAGVYVGNQVEDAIGNILSAAPSGDFWDSLQRCKSRKIRTNGKSGKKTRYYSPDYTHGDLEVWDGQGNHLGSADPQTGDMTKPLASGGRSNDEIP